jgi:hypothetical protein
LAGLCKRLAPANSTRLESILNPVDHSPSIFSAYRYDIEAAGRGGIRGVSLEVQPGGTDEPLLLGPGDAVGAAAVKTVLTVSDLGENQGVTIQHDQVYLACTDLKIPLQCFETAPVQL